MSESESTTPRGLIETVATGIAHEVRNPLNALEINVQILEQELRELVPNAEEHVFQVLKNISNEVRSLDDFVTAFLGYARPPRLKVEPVQVKTLLSDLALFIAPECARKGVTLELHLEKGPALVQLDSFQIKQAVRNLAMNALQATPSGGRIEIATGGDADTLEIEIRDRGEGIPAAIRARVFDLFFTTREGGTGLGLPIAARIAEAHGGAVALESPPGGGTTARLRIPTRAK